MKRLTGLLLALLLLFASAAAAMAKTDDRDPIVYVTGFGSAHLVKGEHQVYPAPGADVAKTIASLAPAYAAYRLNDDTRAFALKIISATEALYAPLRFDDDGQPLDAAVTLDKTNDVTADQPYGKRNYFYYDWRVDVTASADQLSAYIDAILAATGRARVALICSSMGTCVGAAYLTRYGAEKVSSIVLSCAAVNGVPLVSKLMAGTLPLTQSVVVKALQDLNLLDSAKLSAAARRVIDAAGGLDAVLRDVAHVVHAQKELFYARLVVPFLSKMPGVWSLVEQDMADEAKNAAGVRAGSALDQKLSAFFGAVRPQLVPVLKAAQQSGVRLAILSNVTEPAALAEDGLLADGLIPVTLTSFGAACADAGDFFTVPEEAQDERAALVSPDGVIDAAGCAFPEHTWFVFDAAHTITDPHFFLRIAYAAGDVTVTTDARYPRFLKLGEDGRYTPYLPDVGDLSALLETLPSLIEKLRALFAYLLTALRWVVTV